MTGYCEVCQREAEADEEEVTPICSKCGHDLIQGVHVDEPIGEFDDDDWFYSNGSWPDEQD